MWGYFRDQIIYREKRHADCYVCLDSGTKSCLQLKCSHIAHKSCLLKQLEGIRGSGGTVNDRMSRCGICNDFIKHAKIPFKEYFLISRLKHFKRTEGYKIYECARCARLFELPKGGCMDNGVMLSDVRCGKCQHFCPRHGLEFMIYKCRFCCNVANWNCGNVHYCESCHEIIRQGQSVDAQNCIGAPECNGRHPPNGSGEWSIGCGKCLSRV